MPIAQHNRLTFTGVFTSGTIDYEIWSWGLKFPTLVSGAPGTIASFQAQADAAVTAYSTHLKPLFGPTIKLTRVRAAAHQPGGLTYTDANGSYVHADAITAQSGSFSPAVIAPLQTALVVSLLTPQAGASGKGRVFLPYPGHGVGQDYLLSTAGQTLVANSFKAFLTALKTSSGDARVFSSKGTSAPVTSIKVGRVPDTQRSRRSAALENYVTLPL